MKPSKRSSCWIAASLGRIGSLVAEGARAGCARASGRAGTGGPALSLLTLV